MTTPDRITLEYAIAEMRLIALGYEDWLERFSSGPKKRPDTEITRYESKLSVVRWVVGAMEKRKAAENVEA